MELRFRLPKTCSYHRRFFSFQPHVAFHTSTAGFAVLNVITGADFRVADLEDQMTFSRDHFLTMLFMGNLQEHLREP